ncbi:hypothetical protein GCM10007981_17160 [Thermocladium modestius]|uniref:Sec-independent protein translocase protein TatA n=1 Tax=Thermocladium modestius TaxID=62609 RepID=A0A830GXA1_9CREN|nr:twin-arginine translocase TatA/TatE family subunit [Thermocladium modestius]GGP22171.1 hypothetical protein GCM10007981_17160 [Thermocladium modestius]
MPGSVWDWIILIVVALVLFGGASKLPEIFRSLGRAFGEFRKGQIEVENELRQMQSSTPQTQPQQQNQQSQPDERKNDEESVEELKKKIEELQRQVEELKKGK